MAQRRKTRFRLVPPEYESTPIDKADLADRITAQRQRLVQGTRDTGKSSNNRKPFFQLTEQAEQTGHNEFQNYPRSHTMRLLTQQPKLTLIAGVGIAFALPWLLKKVGSKRMLQGLNVVSPLLMAYLNSRQNDIFSDEDSEPVKKS